MKPFLLFTLILTSSLTSAQTLGGSAAFSFVKLPAGPQLSALGGVNTSNISNDAGLAFNNPALLRAAMSNQLNVSFNDMYAGIRNYSASYNLRKESWKTNFSGGVHFVDYGNIAATDAAGNINGNIHPTDYLLQVSASRQYENRWHYGISLRFLQSSYGIYRSAAIVFDAGVAYSDSANGLQASLLLKNMGTQIKRYADSRADDLPFDIQLGITRRLSAAPIQFSATAHHLHQFNIRYNDTAFNSQNGIDPGGDGKRFTIDKIFRHFVFATQVFVTEKIELTLAYNHLRRKELIVANSSTGLTGFSFGAGALFKKLEIRYARSHFQNNTGYNQFGLNLFLNKL